MTGIVFTIHNITFELMFQLKRKSMVIEILRKIVSIPTRTGNPRLEAKDDIQFQHRD